MIELRAKIERLGNRTEGTSKAGKPWKKQEVIVTTEEQYPKTIALTCFNDSADRAASFHPGTLCAIKAELESREFNGRWYTDVVLKSIEPVMQQPQQHHSTGVDNGILTYTDTNGKTLPF